mgnify:CR=1 FL=1
MKDREYLRIIWLAWAQWSDGSWGVWTDLGYGNSRRDLKEKVMEYLVGHTVRWALRKRNGVLTYNNRIRLRKHILPPIERRP